MWIVNQIWILLFGLTIAFGGLSKLAVANQDNVDRTKRQLDGDYEESHDDVIINGTHIDDDGLITNVIYRDVVADGGSINGTSIDDGQVHYDDEINIDADADYIDDEIHDDSASSSTVKTPSEEVTSILTTTTSAATAIISDDDYYNDNDYNDTSGHSNASIVDGDNEYYYESPVNDGELDFRSHPIQEDAQIDDAITDDEEEVEAEVEVKTVEAVKPDTEISYESQDGAYSYHDHPEVDIDVKEVESNFKEIKEEITSSISPPTPVRSSFDGDVTQVRQPFVDLVKQKTQPEIMTEVATSNVSLEIIRQELTTETPLKQEQEVTISLNETLIETTNGSKINEENSTISGDSLDSDIPLVLSFNSSNITNGSSPKLKVELTTLSPTTTTTTRTTTTTTTTTTEEAPVTVLLVPLKSRNVSRARQMGTGSLFEQIMQRQKSNEGDTSMATPLSVTAPNRKSPSNVTPLISKKISSVDDKNVTSSIHNVTLNANTTIDDDFKNSNATTKTSTMTTTNGRRRFPSLSRKPFLPTRSGPEVTRAPFKIATRKTSDILSVKRPSLKPIGRRIPSNPGQSQVEYPSDPDSRTDESSAVGPMMTTTTTQRVVTTLSPYFLWGMSIEVACTLKVIQGANWTDDLHDHDTLHFRQLSNEIQNQLDATYRRSPIGHRFKGTQIEGFSRGSVIVDYTLYLTEASDEPVDTPLLWEAVSKSLDNGTNIGPFTVDPSTLSFEVVRKITPPPEVVAEAQLAIPHWAIAIIVIVLATLLFLVILCLAMTKNRRCAKRKYGHQLRDDSAAIVVERARAWDKSSAYDNLSISGNHPVIVNDGGNSIHGDLYDINDTWDDKKLKQQRSYSQHNLYGTGSNHESNKSSSLSGNVQRNHRDHDYNYHGIRSSQLPDDFRHNYNNNYNDSWRSDWSRSARGGGSATSKPPDYDTTF